MEQLGENVVGLGSNGRRIVAVIAAAATLLGGGFLATPAASAAESSSVASAANVRTSRPVKPERPMTLKERRAQVDKIRAPKEPGTIIRLPGSKALASSAPAPTAKARGSEPGARAGSLAIAAPTNLRVAPHPWFGFDVEWGNVKFDTPAGTESIYQALYRASDNALIKQWCDSDPDGSKDYSAKTFNWGVSDPTILTAGVEYYMKIAVSADRGTLTDPLGRGCATGWSAEARGPNIAAQGRPVLLPSSETYGCVCVDTTGRTPVQGYLGDPVNTATGALNETAVDGAVSAPGVPFALRRTYASDNASVGMLGKGWTSTYDARLEVTDTKVTYVADSGARVAYAKDASTGAYTASSLGVTATLTGSAASGFMLSTGKYGTLTFDGRGKLTSWKDKAGVGLSFTYTDGNLSSINDGAGNTITFTVDPTSRLLTSVDLPGGRSISYGYTSGQLTSVKGTDGGTVTYGYDAGRLASITDAAGRLVMQTSYDQFGLVTQQTDVDGKVTKFTRGRLETNYQDGNGGIWTDLYHGSLLRNRIDPLGKVTSFNYDAKLRLTDAVDARGNRTKMTYDSRGNLLSRIEGMLTQAWTYNTNNTIASYTDGRGAKTTYIYDAKQRLTEESGPAGKTAHTYNAAGQVATTTSPRGKVTAFDYDNRGNLRSETAPSGAKTTYTYDAAGRLLTTTEPRGNVAGADPAKYTTTNAYNAAGLLEKTTDAAGRVTSYEYDANGNQTKLTNPSGQATAYAYNKFNQLATVTAPDGSTTTTNYDAVGNVTSTVDAVGGKTTYSFDKANRLVAKTAPRGNVSGADPAKYTTTYGYDNSGNLARTVDPTGALTTTAYDALNRPTSVTDPLGRIARKKYDGNGNVIELTDALGKITTATYTASDLLSTVKNPLGQITTYAYDVDGNRASVTTPLGRKTSWTYDSDGRMATETDPRGNVTGADPVKFTTTYAYDAAGNQTKVTDPLGKSTTTSYDALNQVVAIINPLGKTKKTGYDELGRIQKVTGPDGAETSYTYNTAGHLATRKDPNGHSTTYGYDAAGRQTSVTDPLNRKQSYSYDPDGNRTTVTNARGVTATTTFDARGLATGTTYSDSTPPVTTTYDAVGQRKTIIDATGTRTLEYDKAGRLTSVTPSKGKGAFGYTYDDAGHLTSRTADFTITPAAGTKISYEYDGDGRRTKQTTAAGSLTYGYDAAGNLTSSTLPSANGHIEKRAYDSAGRLTAISSVKGTSTLASWQQSLDDAGQPTRVDVNRVGKAASYQYYNYDPAGRLLTDCPSATKADSCPDADAATTFTYDPVGNRKTHAKGGVTTDYTYDDTDALTKTVTGSTSRTFTYDDDGNQTGAGSATYTYDANNRLSSVTSGPSTYSYVYDADGNRTSATKAGSGLLRTTTWDINGTLPRVGAEYSGSGKLIADYQYNPLGQIQAETTGAGTFYHHRDLVGSITDLTDAEGDLQTSYSYAAFGEITQSDTATSPPVNRFTYTGEYKEPTTGAAGYYLRARNYTPDTGRFTSRDPHTAGEGAAYDASYNYVGNSPTNRYDPAGTCWWIPNSGDQSCWTAELPGTEWIPLSPAVEKIGNSFSDACENGSEYAKQNGRAGWTGCVDEFTGVGSARRGVDSFQQGDVVDGTTQCLGGVGQFGLFLLPGPKVPGHGSWGSPRLRPGVEAAAPGVGHATGAVWSRISATQPPYAGTLLPKSFNLTTASGRQIWVAPNSTKHIAEEIMHNGFSRDLKTEDLLASLVRSVDSATAGGIQFGRRTLEKGWELIIVPPRGGIGNPVLKHARRLG